MGRDRHSHREVGLAGPGGANPKDDIVGPDGVDVPHLTEAFGSNRTLLGRDINHLTLNLAERLVPLPRNVPEGQLDVVVSNGSAPFHEHGQFPDYLLGDAHLLLGPANGQSPIPGYQPDVKTILHHSDVLIVSAEESLNLGSGRKRNLPSKRCTLAFHFS